MKEKIWLSSPHMSGNEMKYINEAFEQNWIAPLGPNVNGFEKELGEYLGIPHVAVLSSGTAAIHLALILEGIKPGNEVLVSTFTFSATVNPIVYQGAKPVFIDSEQESWNMNPDLLEKAILDRIHKGKKPKAIIVVHLYGMPAKIKTIMQIAEKYNIPVIEDAAEALGSEYQDRRCGTFGKHSILSFNGNKIITTSGGGALVTKTLENVKETRFLATQARDEAPHYQHSKIGYNYRMSNIVAGIGRGQLEVIEDRIKKRRANFDYYLSALGKIEGISFLRQRPGVYSNYWLTTILIEPERTSGITTDDIRLALEAENIESRPLWKPMHMQPVFEKYPAYVDGTSESLFNKGLCLPSGSNLTNEQKDRVISVILRTLKKN